MFGDILKLGKAAIVAAGKAANSELKNSEITEKWGNAAAAKAAKLATSLQKYADNHNGGNRGQESISESADAVQM